MYTTQRGVAQAAISRSMHVHPNSRFNHDSTKEVHAARADRGRRPGGLLRAGERRRHRRLVLRQPAGEQCRRPRFHDGTRHPPVAGAGDRRRWAEGVRPDVADRERPDRAGRRIGNLGCEWRIPGADAAGAAWRRGGVSRSQRVAGGHLDPLARHAPAGSDGRRSAPDDRGGDDLGAHLDHRPASFDAVVSPTSARANGRACVQGRGRSVPDRR